MQPNTYIFFGKPGSGKGTQATLLVKYLEAKNNKVVYIETGTNLRAFNSAGTHMAELTKASMNRGELLPEFLPIWIWTDLLVKHFTGSEQIIFDGVARRPLESELLDSALSFMGISKNNVILISVSPDWSIDRLLGRGRADDSRESVKVRLDAYEENNAPSIEYFRNNPRFNFIEINGEQSIEQVHADIISKLAL